MTDSADLRFGTPFCLFSFCACFVACTWVLCSSPAVGVPDLSSRLFLAPKSTGRLSASRRRVDFKVTQGMLSCVLASLPVSLSRSLLA